MNAPSQPLPRADRRLVEALRARLQASNGHRIELVETHISWVLLTQRHAYKLKKPLRLPFVDFSSLAARKHFCEEELRLNRRLAPSLYLDVVPICGRPNAPLIGGSGTPIDYAVHMQRFPEAALFAERLGAGTLRPAHIDALARRLAEFHRDAPIATATSPYGRPEQIVEPVRALIVQLAAGGAARRSAPLRAWLAEQEKLLQPAWLARRRSGSVRECHGDLHLANVLILDGEPVAFDCIEFDPALRWIDVVSDIAFVTMDLRAHGRRDLAFRLLDGWLQHSGDFDGLAVLRFYEVNRALVRAMVGTLRGASAEAGRTPDYLACAGELALQDAPRARLLITHGVSGSGKSMLAAQLLEAAGAIRLRSDVERKRLHGLEPLARSDARTLDIYTAEATRRTFERLHDASRAALRSGYPVIVDAAFLRRAERDRFRDLAAELGVPFAILHCRADPALLRRRIVERAITGDDPSEANIAVLDRQLHDHEPLGDDERALAFEVDTAQEADAADLCRRWMDVSKPTRAGP